MPSDITQTRRLGRIAGPIMHFSPGKIQQRVRTAQRFSHLKCIEFITYSQPTLCRADSLPISLSHPPLIDVFTRARDFRVFFVIASYLPYIDPASSVAKNKIAMEKF